MISGPEMILPGKEIKYKIADIPPELVKGSKIVTRNESVILTLRSPNRATMEVTYAISILNENGERHAIFQEWYDKFRRIHDISGKIYNKNGEIEKRIRKADIEDYSAIQGFSLYEDTRMKVIRPEYRDFPYTIEYSFKIEFNGLFSYPSFMPYRDYNAAVEKSVFILRFPADNPVRYLEQNMPSAGNRKIEDTDSVIIWEVRNFPSITEEPFSTDIKRYVPNILTAPTKFEIEGFTGDATSWESLGHWIRQLSTGLDELDEESMQGILKLVEDVDDPYERIRVLYKHLQEKTRYVSIQIGIGSWQPFDAETVDRLGYGDCKALSNYMMAILKVAGIPSYYTLINAGSDAAPLQREFPSNQFNHAVLCVPLEDTIWLECTSQRSPCGFLGDFTDDRFALLITEEGGRLAKTKSYPAELNREQRTADVFLDEEGTGRIRLRTTYGGIHYGNMIPVFYDDHENQEEFIHEKLHIPSFKLQSFSYSESLSPEPLISEDLNMQVYNYTSNPGSKVVLPLNLLNDMDELPENLSERRSDVLIRRSEITFDSIRFNLPEDYVLETATVPVILDTDFGHYYTQIDYSEGLIIFCRYFRLNRGLFPPERYGEFLDFLREVHRADQAKAILTGKTNPV